MKKIMFSLALVSSLSFAYDINPKTVEINWTAFKLLSKDGVKGTFDNYSVKLAKTSAKSLKEMLLGSSVKIDSLSVDAQNSLKNSNISNFFFKKFAQKDIDAKIIDMMEGKNVGTLSLEVTMNNVTRVIPMQYKINDGGKLEATGTLEMMDFNLKSAYDSLAAGCGEYHKGVTWTQVDIGFELYITK